MIAYLSGVIEKDIESIVIDVAGVGYRVSVSISDFSQMVQGDTAKLYIYEHIREDAYDLYGFISTSSKKLFEQLISVKNVGPKVALAVMSIGSEQTLRSAIANGDIKLLQSAKGVGKRAAEQMVVELRDKVGLVSSAEAEGIVHRGTANLSDEAMQGLIALGYSEADAQAALSGIDESLPVEDRIKTALKGTF